MKLIILLVILGLVFGGALILYAATTKTGSPKPTKKGAEKSEGERENEVLHHAPKDNHSESHGSSAGHGGGDHHGPSLLDRLVTFAFLAFLAYGAYWFYQNLHSLEGRPHVKHPVQVVTAGSNPVPVGSRSIPQYHECSTKAPEGSTLYLKSESYSDAVVIPEGQTICDDSFKTGVRVRYLFHHPGMDSDQYDTEGSRRVDRVKISTDEDVHVWIEDL